MPVMEKVGGILWIALIIAMVAISACTGSGANQPVETPLASHPVVSIKMTVVNGIITADLTNNIDHPASYTIMVTFYDGNVKLYDRYIDFINLASGETGRNSGSFPTDANRYVVAKNAITYIGDKYYPVETVITYQ